MPKITSVEPQKTLRPLRQSSGQVRSGQAPKRFNIFLDGIFAFGADEDLVVNQRLTVGKQIDQEKLNKLLFEAEAGKLIEKAYNFLSFRMRSEKEIRDWLKVKSLKEKVKNEQVISQAVTDLVVERLKQKSLINDLEFAKAWVEGRRRSKNLGIRALRMELYKKGIDKEIIEEVLRLRSGQVSEEVLAKLALEKKLKFWKNLDKQNFKKKATEFLLRRGFDYEVAKEVVENFF